MSEAEVDEQASEFFHEADFIGRVFERLVRNPHHVASADIAIGELLDFHAQVEAARVAFGGRQ